MSSSHTQRWSTPTGRQLQVAAVRWLAGDRRIPDGLQRIDGLVDLRGLTWPAPEVLRGMVTPSSRCRIDGDDVTLTGIEWRDLDLSGATLAGLRFVESDVLWSRLDGARGQGWHLGGSSVQGCSFDKADLRGLRMNDALVAGSTFGNTRLVGARFHGVSVVDCDFSGVLWDVEFIGLDSAGRQLSMAGVDFARATFDQVSLLGYALAAVTLPASDDVRLIRRYPVVARRALDLAAQMGGLEAKVFAGMLRATLTRDWPRDSDGVFNRRDFTADLAGVAEFADHVLRLAERDVWSAD